MPRQPKLIYLPRNQKLYRFCCGDPHGISSASLYFVLRLKKDEEESSGSRVNRTNARRAQQNTLTWCRLALSFVAHRPYFLHVAT